MNQRNYSKLTLVEPAAEMTVLTASGAPVASGKGDMDLVCGKCGAVLVQGETAADVAAQYKVLKLAVKCQCGSLNLLA